MIKYIFVSLCFLLCFSCGKGSSDNGSGVPLVPSRIISFAPNITEMLYELGLGEKVVGVTQFCNYPPQAAQKEKVGAHNDVNYEAVVRLKPDLVVILKEQRDMIAFLDKYGLHYITAGSDSVEEIIRSIQAIAAACGAGERGDSLARGLRSRMDGAVPPNVAPPRVLLCVSRDNIGSGTVNKCFAAGASSFYNQLIESAGGVNVLKDIPQAYPAIGAEAVMRLAPDIIIDISSSYIAGGGQERAADCGDWGAFKSVPAVKTNNARCLRGDYLTIPGPRFVLILEALKTIFSEYAQTRS